MSTLVLFPKSLFRNVHRYMATAYIFPTEYFAHELTIGLNGPVMPSTRQRLKLILKHSSEVVTLRQ